MLYYHRIVGVFTNSNQRGSSGPYKLQVEMTIDNVPDSNPSTLWNSVFFVVYGYPRDWTKELDVNTVRDVYDGHPVIQKSTTTSSTTTSTSETIPSPRNKQITNKSTVTPVGQGGNALRPAFVYCNVGEKQHGRKSDHQHLYGGILNKYTTLQCEEIS